MDAKKRERSIALLGFGVWAGGIGFIVAVFYIVYLLATNQGIGILDVINVIVPLLAYVYFRLRFQEARARQKKCNEE